MNALYLKYQKACQEKGISKKKEQRIKRKTMGWVKKGFFSESRSH